MYFSSYSCICFLFLPPVGWILWISSLLILGGRLFHLPGSEATSVMTNISVFTARGTERQKKREKEREQGEGG